MKTNKVGFPLVSFFLVLLFFMSCNGGGTNSSGVLSLDLTDASTDNYKAVYITIDEVQVHRDGENDDNWQTVASLFKTYDLLVLINGVREQLGVTQLETGHYTQMRLIIGETPDNGTNILSESHQYGNYVIDLSDTYHELKVPSGFQTGVKIVHGFDINESRTTELILDFDTSNSIVEAGNSGKLLLKPTIKVIETEEASLVSGVVTAADTADVLARVLITAQIFDSEAPDQKDAVSVQASSMSDTDGSFTLLLEPGTYNIVVYKDGYDPDCIETTLASGDSYIQDFTMNTTTTGNLNGTITIDGNDEQYVTISIRQDALCAETGEDVQIEVKSFSVANGGDYTVGLPQEITYTVIAYTSGEETQIIEGVEIPANLNFDF